MNRQDTVQEKNMYIYNTSGKEFTVYIKNPFESIILL